MSFFVTVASAGDVSADAGAAWFARRVGRAGVAPDAGRPATTIVTIALCLALVPRCGIMGTAAASGTATVVVNAWNLLWVRRLLGFVPYNRGCLRLVLSTTISVIVVLFSKAMADSTHAWMNIGMGLLAAYGSFFGVLLLSGLGADDRIGHVEGKRMKGFRSAIDVGAS